MCSIRRASRVAGLIACLLASTAVNAPTAHAGAELTVSPLVMKLGATAGDELTETITATASGDEAITVELVHADFGFGEDYQVVLIRDDAPETTAFSTRDWFSMPKKQYRIPAGQSRDLPLTIAVPGNTPGGTYLGAALLRIVPPPVKGGGSQVQAVPETGPLVFVAVEGGDPPKAAMKEFDVPRLMARGPISPKLVIENTGDEFFTYSGTVKLSGPGKDRHVDVSDQVVVPGEPRTIRTSADDKGATGSPKIGTSKLGMGRYEVTARLRIEPVGTTLVATRTVWIIPVWARVVAGVLLVVFLVCVWFLARWLSHRREAARPYHEELGDGTTESDDAFDADEDEDEAGEDLLDHDEDLEGHEDDEEELDEVEDEPSDEYR